jgi:CheY-like chemotaxis protein
MLAVERKPVNIVVRRSSYAEVITDHQGPTPARAVPESERPPHPDQGSGPSRTSATAVGPRHRVLIVDDDADTRELYGWCMKAGGWLVHAVRNGAEALLAAPEFEPDVIVMDLRLPVLGGLDAIRHLKSDEATKQIPIVACTAFDRRSSEIEARDAGCDEFFPKPCEPEHLRKLLEAMVRTGPS